MYSEYVEYADAPRQDHAEFGTKWLAEHGYDDWEVVVATDETLQLDYDTVPFGSPLPEVFERVLHILEETFEVESIPYKTYASKGGNTHVIVTLPHGLAEHKRVAWQAAFGSDPVREALHLQSIAKKHLNPMLLFMHKKRDQKLLAAPQVKGYLAGQTIPDSGSAGDSF
jgi:hypothetical protein